MSLPLLALNITPIDEEASFEDIGVAKGFVFEGEVVWAADKPELDALTCFPGGRCGYEAVFNLFPWPLMGPDGEPLATQQFESFTAAEIVRDVADDDYGLSSQMMIKLATDLYANFVGLYAQFAKSARLMLKAIRLAESSGTYVQSFYDAEAILLSGGLVPKGSQLTKLIKKRFDTVKRLVAAADGAVGADFVVNSGNHFKVYRMRDTTPGSIAPLKWHVIDAWFMESRGTITKASFDARRMMPQADAMEALMEFAFMDNPQAIAVVFRPKIAKDPDNLELCLNLWEAASNAGKSFKMSLY